MELPQVRNKRMKKAKESITISVESKIVYAEPYKINVDGIIVTGRPVTIKPSKEVEELITAALLKEIKDLFKEYLKEQYEMENRRKITLVETMELISNDFKNGVPYAVEAYAEFEKIMEKRDKNLYRS